MKTLPTIRSLLACLPALSLALSGCAAANMSANPVCTAGSAMSVEGFPASIMLPVGAVIDSQSSGSPPEFASDNYQVVAHSTADIDAVRGFYRCALPEQGFPVIDEEQGNFWLLRFSGPGVDDGSVLIGDGSNEGEVSIQISLVEKES